MVVVGSATHGVSANLSYSPGLDVRYSYQTAHGSLFNHSRRRMDPGSSLGQHQIVVVNLLLHGNPEIDHHRGVLRQADHAEHAARVAAVLAAKGCNIHLGGVISDA